MAAHEEAWPAFYLSRVGLRPIDRGLTLTIASGDRIDSAACRRIGAANDRRRREGIRKNGSLATAARTKPGPSAHPSIKLPATRFCTPSFVLAAPILRHAATLT